MTRETLIEKIKSKEIGLSYSWLKNFTSPIEFLRYKLKKFTQNSGMLFGSLCDVLVLTPNDLFKDFALVEKSPSTPNQKQFVEELVAVQKKNGEIKDRDIEEAFRNNYKTGNAKKTFEILADYIYAVASGKMIIDNDILAKAREVVANLKKFPDVAHLFSQITTTQHKMEWVEQGWKFKGFLDFTIPNVIFDLKYSKSADPDEFIRTIYNLGYDLQAGTYIRGAMATGLFEDPPAYFFLVYDDKGNYSVIQMDWSFIHYGMRKLDYYIEAINRLVEEDAWDESYNFFNRKATAYKPKWAKAYPLLADIQEDGI